MKMYCVVAIPLVGHAWVSEIFLTRKAAEENQEECMERNRGGTYNFVVQKATLTEEFPTISQRRLPLK